jgi:capsule synthesis protein PGA_cap
MRSWSKLMGLETMRGPVAGAGDAAVCEVFVDAGSVFCKAGEAVASGVAPDAAGDVDAAVAARGDGAGWRAHPIRIVMIVATIVASITNLSAQENKDKVVDLWLAGDVNLGDGGRGQLLGIKGIVQGAAGIVNLEGPVARRSQLRFGLLRLWNSPDALREVADLNVKVAGIANNHSGDAGSAGLQRSADVLRAHGLLPAGGPAGAAVLRMSGLTIAVTAHDLTHGVPKDLAADLAAARKQAEVLIATFHVTGPPSYLPRPELKRAVEIAYQAGASVIAAHGTHALGPVERREHAVIAWGLGNVAFACDCTHEEDAMILRVRLGDGKLVRVEVVPIRSGLDKKPAGAARDANAMFDLLEAIGSSKLVRKGDVAEF